MTDLAADGAHAAPPAPDTSHLPLMLAPDAGADAAVMAAEVEAMADAGQDAGEGGHSSGGDGDGTLEELHLLQALEGAQGGLGLPPDSTLDHALEAVDLDGLTADQVAELESGDADRMAAVLQVKEAPAGRGTGDGSGLNRVSIKALPPAARLKLVEAISRVRDGGDFEAALREAFPPAQQEEADAEAWQARDAAHQELPASAPATRGHAVAEVEGRLEGLRLAYEQAKAEYDPRSNDLLEQMMDLKLDLREARQAEAGHARDQRASYERAMQQHADIIHAAESPFMDLCDMMISLAERNNDRILTLPDWPEQIAKQVRSRFFRGTAAGSAAPWGGLTQMQAPVPPAPQNRVRLPGSPAGNGVAAGSVTPETALAEFDRLTAEEQEATLAEIARAADGRRR